MSVKKIYIISLNFIFLYINIVYEYKWLEHPILECNIRSKYGIFIKNNVCVGHVRILFI